VSSWLTVLALCLGLTSLDPVIVRTSGPDHESVLKHMLSDDGQPFDTPEDLKAALHSKRAPIREIAIKYFTQREGERFVPTLREYLSYEHVRVRYTAARLLNNFGDRSGLEQMRSDFQNLLLPGKSPEDPGDPGLMGVARLQDALEIGGILANLEDERALPLALKALQHKLPAVRSPAVRAVGRIARDGETRQEAVLALAALVNLAEREPERTVHGAIAAVALNMEPRSAIKLFEAVVRNPHIPGWLRKVTLEDKANKEQELQRGTAGSVAATSRPTATGTPAISSQPAASSPAGSSVADPGACFRELDPHRNAQGMRLEANDVKLVGVARGGELVLLQMLNPSPRYVRVATHVGENAETVIERMAAAINELNPFGWNPNWNPKGLIPSEGNLLKSLSGAPGAYIFAGTETGLGIPPPPTSLSVSYAPDSQEVALFWEDPDEPLDGIQANIGGVLAGNATHVAGKWGPPEYKQPEPKIISRARDRGNAGLRRFYVIGCRNGVLSNAAVITLNYKDGSQEELDTQPFTGGIAPNWKPWTHGNEPGGLVLEEGTKGERKRFDQAPKSPLKAEDKSFYQSIKTRSSTAVGGVCRKFLGLKAGHTYRLWTRMNTLKMDEAAENWSFSFHAATHAKGVTLSPEQMAGAAALPDGGSGPAGGQIAAYGPGNTTKGKFEEVSTEKKAGPRGQAVDITLPAGAEVITVWFRVSGAIPTGVGFDWIKLKDVTPK